MYVYTNAGNVNKMYSVLNKDSSWETNWPLQGRLVVRARGRRGRRGHVEEEGGGGHQGNCLQPLTDQETMSKSSLLTQDEHTPNVQQISTAENINHIITC